MTCQQFSTLDHVTAIQNNAMAARRDEDSRFIKHGKRGLALIGTCVLPSIGTGQGQVHIRVVTSWLGRVLDVRCVFIKLYNVE